MLPLLFSLLLACRNAAEASADAYYAGCGDGDRDGTDAADADMADERCCDVDAPDADAVAVLFRGANHDAYDAGYEACWSDAYAAACDDAGVEGCGGT